MSVLTDVDFFQGADENIAIARNHCALPALRKDFLVDPYNVVEARALHADCILLIVACLSDQQLEEMSKTAFEHQLDVLVEVHDEYELERALKLSEQCILGVNNRNLKTFDVDLNTSLRLKKLLPASRVLVTESGIATPADVEMMQTNDIHTFLVGESFMKQPRPDHAFTALFGQPETIKVNGKKPRVVFFVGPTGVGKTTTIAKIASKFKVNYNKNIAFITADTYRIAATDQLRTFANILDTPLSVIYTATELNSAVAEYEQADVIFVDTAGFSHKNETQRNDMRALLAGLSPEYEKSVYLVLSATTKYRDLISIIDSYKDIDDYKLIFTKLDETSSYGNLLNIKLYSDAGISYVTNGQNVPDDIEVFDTQKIVKQLLGGRQ